MSNPAPASPKPAQERLARQELPEGALTREQVERFEERLSIDGDAALAWLMGEGPDPWRGESE